MIVTLTEDDGRQILRLNVVAYRFQQGGNGPWLFCACEPELRVRVSKRSKRARADAKGSDSNQGGPGAHRVTDRNTP